MKITERLINSVSYKRRRERKLVATNNEVNKYMSMSKNEFLMDYIEIKSRYEHKKIMFIVFFITITISVVMNVWKYSFIFFNKLVFTDKLSGEMLRSARFLPLFIMVFIILVSIFIVLWNVSVMHKLNRQLIFMEQLKEMRNNGKV